MKQDDWKDADDHRMKQDDWKDADDDSSPLNDDPQASNTKDTSDHQTANDQANTDDTRKASDKIEAMTKPQAFAVATYFNNLMETNPLLTQHMVGCFAEKTTVKPGFSDWMKSSKFENQPFEAFQKTTFEIGADDNKFLADTVAESIAYPDQVQYQLMIQDPEKEAIRFIKTESDAPEVQKYASDIRKAAQHAQETLSELEPQMSDALINRDRQTYNNIIDQMSKQFLDVATVTTTPPKVELRH